MGFAEIGSRADDGSVNIDAVQWLLVKKCAGARGNGKFQQEIGWSVKYRADTPRPCRDRCIPAALDAGCVYWRAASGERFHQVYPLLYTLMVRVLAIDAVSLPPKAVPPSS